MISKKAREIPPFIVMDVLEKAQEYERLVKRSSIWKWGT